MAFRKDVLLTVGMWPATTVESRLAKSKIAGYQLGRGYSKADWDEVSDSPEATSEELTEAKPFAEVFPELAEKMRRTRGPQQAPTKVSGRCTSIVTWSSVSG